MEKYDELKSVVSSAEAKYGRADSGTGLMMVCRYARQNKFSAAAVASVTEAIVTDVFLASSAENKLSCKKHLEEVRSFSKFAKVKIQ